MSHTNLEKLNVNIYDKEMMMNVSECLKELIYESTDIELFEKLLKMPKIEKIKIGDLEELEDKEFNFDQEFSTIEYLKIRPE